MEEIEIMSVTKDADSEAALAMCNPLPAIQDSWWEVYQPLPSETLGQRLDRIEQRAQAEREREENPRGYILPTLISKRDGFIVLDSYASSASHPSQLRQAEYLYEFGLKNKAQRQLGCGLYGGIRECRSGDANHRFYIPYRCGNRYCLNCGRAVFAELFHKHLRLRAVVAKLVPHWPVHGHRPSRVLAKIDFTVRNSGKTDGAMPTAEEVRAFNQDIRKFFRAVERRFGVSRKEYGFLWCDEFGGKGNSNLHAHGIYAGPWLPQKNKELSSLWQEIRKDGSFIVSIKTAKSFEAGLAHALKYAGKFLSHDPARLAQLEKTFHGVRRVHALAQFYRPKLDDPEPSTVSPQCPLCGEPLGEPSGWSWQPVSSLRSQGIRELDEVRREVGRSNALGGAGGAPS